MTPGRRNALILGAAGLAAAGAGFVAGPWLLQRGDNRAEGRALFAATLPDLSGKPRRLSEWQGRALLVNFWATWCAPCREEIPLLAAALQKYGPGGVEIVGIAIDHADKIAEYSKTITIPYPVLYGVAEGLELMRLLGNASGGLPYTLVFDRNGALTHRKLGALNEADLDRILRPLART